MSSHYFHHDRVFAPHGRLLAAICLALGVSACGAGGSGGGENGVDIVADSPTASVERAARPGEVVLMQVGDGVAARDIAAYSWTQVDGPPVRIGDPRRRHAHFLMPAVDVNVELTFVVDIHRRDGSIDSEMHTVACEGEPGEPDPTEPAVTGEYVVFRADKDIDDRTDLYLAMLDGSALYRLNGNLTPGGDVSQFKISPDRQHIAYLADQDVDGRPEVYVAAADGSGQVRVSPDLQAGDYIDFYAWSPDGSMIGIEATRDGGYTVELFTNSVDGGQLTRVSGDQVENGQVFGFRWSPTGSLLAYSADQNTDGVNELFVSSSDGTGNYRVSELFDVDQDVSGGFRWAPDGSAIAYAAFDSSDSSAEIFVVDSDGANRRRVSHARPNQDHYLSTTIDWSPDGSVIAYEDYYYYIDSFSGTSTYTENLFTAAADGSGGTEVSALPIVFGESRSIATTRWAPDGTRIAYIADQDTDDVTELYTSGPGGAGNVRVSGTLVADGDVRSTGFAWAPDSSLIGYRADQDVDSVVELYLSDPLGTVNVKVSGTMQAGGNVGTTSWSPDSSYLAYEADQVADSRIELFTARRDGSANLRVSGPLAIDGDVQGYAWAGDGSRLVYRADKLEENLYELFVAAPDGSVVNANISGALTTNGDVFDFATE